MLTKSCVMRVCMEGTPANVFTSTHVVRECRTGGFFMLRIRESLAHQRRKIIPSVIAVTLAAGFGVSIIATPNAQADYNVGCGYGYNSAGLNFGHGTGSQYAYGFLKNGSFGYGYGNEICPLAVTTATPARGATGTRYFDALAGDAAAGTVAGE